MAIRAIMFFNEDQTFVRLLVQCGSEFIKVGTKFVQDATACGLETITDIAKCGSTIIQCGTEIVRPFTNFYLHLLFIPKRKKYVYSSYMLCMYA